MSQPLILSTKHHALQVKWLTNLEEVPAVIRMKTLDMKEIAETFGLWDEVYQKEVVKELEASQVF